MFITVIIQISITLWVTRNTLHYDQRYLLFRFNHRFILYDNYNICIFICFLLQPGSNG